MDLPINPFKAALRAGRQQTGIWCTIADTTVAEMLAGCGYDWMLFDAEHSALDALTVLPLLQAVAPYPTHAVVRPRCLDEAEIKRLLDFGAQSLLIPMINTAEEARRAAAAVAYAPDGMRGVAGMTRASGFGTISDYPRRARAEICLLVQVETRQALDNLDAILAVGGVDGVFIGPADLAASLGHPGEPNHPTVRAACVDAIRRIRAAGKPAGFLTLDPPVLTEMIAAGSLFTAVDVDIAILRRGAVEMAERWKQGPA
jgi:4-hydroxy-2-oxoheptanedioate aldolase